ncbi:MULTISPECIES: hypothetical protein [unclassified Clostridium]|uniref:hypothetical protein n=1 Tax=unclassified Clostridium TaxID=2614128 RepID=UPI000298675F|nr:MULTISPECIES: hypothetical protein [unclassified Clostridium]EKQ53063.1 MAG: hypothetical protein A370_03915 [Clostridium sp. Maddingley MBC34-26]
MKIKNTVAATDKSKVIIINILFASSIIIIFLGIFFSIFSFVNNINFKILSSSIPGAVFGFLVFYLGIRYYLSVTKLKGELYKTSSKFSWSNFKSKKTKKIVSTK